ncbi:MAG: sensor histidine kinase, partial [Micromonosporaceae bacterium]|nr:sensor histidine kinase [Micromonosporaceae bacterium]
ELRATLAVLRDGAPLLPQPRLPQLPELAEQVRAAGLRVQLRLPSELSEVDTSLSPAVELTAYRIVQEALTNAVRHSGAQAVWVDLRRGDGTLLVDVSDDGCGLPIDAFGRSGGPRGMGLRGMRERAESVGGSLTLGTRDGGGCRVTASLPAGWVEPASRPAA